MTSSTLQCKGNPAWKCKQRCLEANNRQENVEGQGNQNRFCLVEWVAEITECMVCSPSNRIIHWKVKQGKPSADCAFLVPFLSRQCTPECDAVNSLPCELKT